MIYLDAILVMVGIGVGITVLLLLAAKYLCRYGRVKVRINGKDAFEQDGGGKLLDALYDHSIFIPSACGGQGTCGFCKVCVKAGGGPLLPTEEPFMSDDERAKGMRLACQVKLREDVELEIKPEYLSVKQVKATVAATELVAADIREIHLALPEGTELPFVPGQYVQVQVPNRKETVFRAYSLASPPSRKNEIELLVRHIPEGLGSTYLHSLKAGEPVTFTGPYGDFKLEESSERALVCVGGGVGMAPMRSLLRHLAEVNPEKECWLFFGARTEEQLLYRKEFAELAAKMPHFHLHFALSEPEKSPEWKGETGFIHQSVEANLPSGSACQAFLCGPPKMLEAARKVLRGKGLADTDIFADEF